VSLYHVSAVTAVILLMEAFCGVALCFGGVVPDVSEDRSGFVVSVSPKDFETSGTIRSETCIFMHVIVRGGRSWLGLRNRACTACWKVAATGLGNRACTAGCDWFTEQSVYSAGRNWL
jgi:hypothetical protein